MSSFDRRFILGTLPVLFLAGCGFEPTYATGGAGAELRGQLLVGEPSNADSYILVQELEQRLGQATNPNYRLNFALEIESEGLAVTETGSITRYSVTGVVAYGVIPMGADEPIFTNTAQNFTGYSATGSTVETLSAERDARRRLMVILADQITRDLYTNWDADQ